MLGRLAVLLSMVALAAAAFELPGAVDGALESLDRGRPSPAAREVAPAHGLGVSDHALVRARRLIPPDASYGIALGDAIPLDDNQRIGIPQLLRYWLLPRRYVDDLDDADWVIAYGHSSETLGVPVAAEVELAPLVNAVRVAR